MQVLTAVSDESMMKFHQLDSSCVANILGFPPCRRQKLKPTDYDCKVLMTMVLVTQ